MAHKGKMPKFEIDANKGAYQYRFNLNLNKTKIFFCIFLLLFAAMPRLRPTSEQKVTVPLWHKQQKKVRSTKVLAYLFPFVLALCYGTVRCVAQRDVGS